MLYGDSAVEVTPCRGKTKTTSSMAHVAFGAPAPINFLQTLMTPSDLVGLIGVITCLVAYAGLQVGRFQHDDLRYLGLNILSPACLLISLMHDFNLAAVITQVLWLGLSFIGLLRAMYARSRKTEHLSAKCAENKT